MPSVPIGQRICSGVGVEDPGRAGQFGVGDFRPNPFLHATTVRVSLPEAGRATLRVYDLAGRLVRTLADGELAAGEHSAAWDARDDAGARVRPGMYFARLANGGRVALGRVLFVR